MDLYKVKQLQILTYIDLLQNWRTLLVGDLTLEKNKTCHHAKINLKILFMLYSLERNSKTGTAIWLVAESLDMFNKTSGNNFTMMSLISNIQVVNAITTLGMHRLTNPKQ